MTLQSDNAHQTPGLRAEMELFLEAIYRKYHYDFRGYVRLRWNAGSYKHVQNSAAGSVDGTPEADDSTIRTFTAVLDRLTIQCSEMFRDPSYFRS